MQRHGFVNAAQQQLDDFFVFLEVAFAGRQPIEHAVSRRRQGRGRPLLRNALERNCAMSDVLKCLRGARQRGRTFFPPDQNTRQCEDRNAEQNY